MIQNDGLKSGDKLPSERELSDRLMSVSSSIREALRAIELLDLLKQEEAKAHYDGRLSEL